MVQQQRQLIAMATPRRKIQFSGKPLLLGHRMQQKPIAKPECVTKAIVYSWLYTYLYICMCMCVVCLCEELRGTTMPLKCFDEDIIIRDKGIITAIWCFRGKHYGCVCVYV